MAVTDAYATAAQYRSAIGKDDTSEDTDVLTDLTAITRYLETRLQRFFTKDAAAVDRNYYMTRIVRKELRGELFYLPDDLVSVTTFTSDENDDGTAETAWTSGTDFLLWPRNAAVGSEPAPYQALFVPYASTTTLRWVPGRLATLNGVFGWPAVPSAIQRGTIHLTAILRLETPRAERQVSAIGEILGASSQAQGIIYDLIQNYARTPTL